ncbi:MAG: isoprenylcysteine carboxylmethyltransferase family protein [Hyphomonadaceae bacterium]|jgi:protein-S-isoprenylcysteine O-methyltransferase Ste14|nr:isoprenylcysteine carboxylmethyltransferase family protein [Hyphomonadaceae bacterium]
MPTGAPPAQPAVDLQKLQRRRKRILWGMFGLAALCSLFTGSAWWPTAKVVYKTIEWIGIALIFVCIFGRTWCTLYIGGRKKRELVALGPYSICRNPLYAFTTLGAFGVGAQSGSIAIAGVVGAATFAVFWNVTQHEERVLAETFGAEYRRYAERVPAFLPRLEGWTDAQGLMVTPHLILRTFLDATLFLLAIPASEVIEQLQRQGYLPILLRLP